MKITFNNHSIGYYLYIHQNKSKRKKNWITIVRLIPI